MEGKKYDDCILKAVRDSSVPVGAIRLSEEMDIPSANIGRTLLRLEKRGFVQKIPNKGRTITEAGRIYLEEQDAKNSRIDMARDLISYASVENKQNLLDVLEVRKLLEGYTARRCARTVTDEMMEQLLELQMDYVYELRHGRAGSEQDLRLHLKIAECSGNSAIAGILKLLLTDNDSYAEFTRAAISQNQLDQGEHGAILEAIRLHNAERAEHEMQCHLERVAVNVRQSFRTTE